jgi:hypothetical protein
MKLNRPPQLPTKRVLSKMTEYVLIGLISDDINPKTPVFTNRFEAKNDRQAIEKASNKLSLGAISKFNILCRGDTLVQYFWIAGI